MVVCFLACAEDGYNNDGTGELESFNITCNSSRAISHFAYGITANMAAVFLYGSNFVPVKRVETGDGMFFQWVQCAAIWVVSMFGDLMLQSPKFCPFAMLGGVLWATGIVEVEGFGLIFFFVKADVELLHSSETIPLLIDRRTNSGSDGQNSSESWIDTIGPKSKRFIGFLLAVVAGLMYAFSIIPVLYIKSNSVQHDSMFYESSVYDLDYVHAHCCGIFIASTVYFAIYCAAMNTKPKLYSRAVLPGRTLFLKRHSSKAYCMANNYLNSVITFPIITAGYGLVAALWGCLVFKEIKGLANCLIFSLASCVVLTGSVLTAVSNL
ncbi:transmembrane protein 144b [Neolamprologus brichardi]|uniref:transmembrane protein 144b n=1 Tax=Neolamprologus brichardi TaxID=32507 RepID=UPI001643A215|nr:transmembrane protein 144b [Neolamprologus brichardi]